MSRQTKQRAALQHLRSLANQPYEQAGHALEILERERSTQVVSEALEALAHAPVREGRPLLLRLYTYYDKAGVKRDAGEDLLRLRSRGERGAHERVFAATTGRMRR